jgi:hypothetical protein
MKSSLKLVTVCIFLLLNSHTVFADDPQLLGPEEQQSQLKSQAGCFEVNFDFKETQTLIAGNQPSPEYHAKGLEYVLLDQDEPGHLIFQHVLVTPMGPQKHWRQEWVYEGTETLTFQGTRHWLTEKVADPTGKWVQKVYQVDDSPRYECSAAWNTQTQSWDCEAPSPLPRREFTVRSDYEVLMRGNHVAITADGWIHGQKNKKVSLATQPSTVLAIEEGANTYTRTDMSRCQAAIDWWATNGATWKVIQDMWLHIRGHHKELKLKAKVNDKLLWERLFEEAELATVSATFATPEFQKKVHDVIHEYFE